MSLHRVHGNQWEQSIWTGTVLTCQQSASTLVHVQLFRHGVAWSSVACPRCNISSQPSMRM